MAAKVGRAALQALWCWQRQSEIISIHELAGRLVELDAAENHEPESEERWEVIKSEVILLLDALKSAFLRPCSAQQLRLS